MKEKGEDKMNKFNFKIGRLGYFISVLLVYFLVFWIMSFLYLNSGLSENMGLGADISKVSNIITNYIIISVILFVILVIVQAMRLRDRALSGFISIPIMLGWCYYFLYTLIPCVEAFPYYKYSESIIKINDTINPHPSLAIIFAIFTIGFTLFLCFAPHKEKTVKIVAENKEENSL